MCKRALLLLLLLAALVAPAHGQVTGPPFTFTAGTVISPDEMNTNFSTIYDDALNRFAGTMAGNLTFSPSNTYDLSGMRDLAVSRNATVTGTLGVTGATTLSSTLGVSGTSTLAALSATTGTFSSTVGVTGVLTASNTGATALTVAGGITAGSGAVGIVNTAGKIPAISSTYFASLSGANLTGIPESALNDDSLLARVAANETISGNWDFSSFLQSKAVAPFFGWWETGAGADAKRWYTTVNSSTWSLNTLTDAGVFGAQALAISRSGTTPATMTVSVPIYTTTSLGTGAPVFSFSGDTNTGIAYNGSDVFEAVAGGAVPERWTSTATQILLSLIASNTISPAALANGNNNNYAPTGLSTAYMLRLTADAGGSTLTGLTAQTAGSIRVICNISGGTLNIPSEDANSTAANRFTLSATVSLSAGDCMTGYYDGTSARWRRTGR